MAGKAHAMVSFSDPATGAVLTSATVNVYNPGTVTPISATMFDKNGNVLTNPLTADSVTGLVDAYVNVAQEVDMVVAKSGYTTRTYSNVPFIDDASNDLTALLTTTGDMAYASSANTPARLPIAVTANAILAANGGIPAWSTTVTNPAAGGIAISSGGIQLTGGGPVAVTITKPTGAYGVVAADIVIAQSGGANVNLPAANAVSGRTIMYKNVSGGNITVNRAGADTIWDTAAGQTSLLLSSGQAVVLTSDGVSQWYVWAKAN